MTKARRRKDFFLNFITYFASSISVVILLAIFSFVIITGKDSLNLQMLTSNYWSENYLVSFSNQKPIDFELKTKLNDNQAYSKKYGIIVEDIIDNNKEEQVVINSVMEGSIFNETLSMTAGKNLNKHQVVDVGDKLERLTLINEDGQKIKVGTIYKSKAKDITKALDASVEIESLYYTTASGGIWGSLIATLKLIGMSLMIALPLGVFAAIYLNEISNKSKLSKLIEASIELLAGVPSIIFGLMGVIVLYPITLLFNVEGLSILLGSLTMAVILLPVVIRSTQESLKTVPDGLRMASLSLGASQSQTIFKVVLPYARSGILSAILLSISRVIGESAALIYTMGTFINDSPKLTNGATTLAVHIWSIMNQEQPNFELASAISIIILIVVLTLNMSVKYINRRLDRKLGH